MSELIAEPSTTVAPPKNHGARAWELMYEIFKASKPYVESVASSFELTPQQVYALKGLQRDRPLVMSDLATFLGCDASNVTAIVDKLESRGLVERRSADRDRRVKALLLTPAGQDVLDRINDRMQLPPPAINNLDASDKVTLCEVLGRALDSLNAS